MAAFKLVPTPEGINCMPLLHPSPARSTRNEANKKTGGKRLEDPRL